MVPTEEFWKFVEQHLGEDVARLRLRHHGDPREWIADAITCVECRQKAGRKFRLDDGRNLTPRLLVSPLAVEQATAAQVALIHAQMAGEARRVLDMTCGLGMDVLLMAEDCQRQITAIERQPQLAAATAWNLSQHTNVDVVCTDSVQWLSEYRGAPFDLVMLDPARRAADGSRVYNLHSCEPDITSLLPLLRQKARRVMVKLSPMLDVTQTLRDLPNTSELHIIDHRGECKELCAILDFTTSTASPIIILHTSQGLFRYAVACTDVPSARCTMACTDVPSARCNTPAVLARQCNVPKARLCQPQHLHTQESQRQPDSAFLSPAYLYEPSPSAMKAGLFAQYAAQSGLRQLSANTHIFVGDTRPQAFPGRGYRVEQVWPLTSSTLRTLGRELCDTIGQADIAVRNIPDISPRQLQRRLQLPSGGPHRLLAASTPTDRLLFLLSPLSTD